MIGNALVIVPAYNESINLEKTLTELVTMFSHIVVVNDGSTDNTLEIATKYPVDILNLPANLGQGGALMAGFRYFIEFTKLPYCITIDADGQHSLTDAVNILDFLVTSQADIIFGSRFLNSGSSIPLIKQLVLQMGIAFERVFFGIRQATDAHNGLRAMNRHACHSILPLRCLRMAHATEIRSKSSFHSLNILEFPVTVLYSEKRSQNPLNLINIVSDLFIA